MQNYIMSFLSKTTYFQPKAFQYQFQAWQITILCHMLRKVTNQQKEQSRGGVEFCIHYETTVSETKLEVEELLGFLLIYSEKYKL